MISNQLAQGTVYFTGVNGETNFNVLYTRDGRTFHVAAPGQLSQTLADTTKSPLAAAANKLYDMFSWYDAGTYRCTRGPAWTSDTARGSGAGTTEIKWVNGFPVNARDITNGPAAGLGIYNGTIYTNGSSLIDWNPTPAAASGGGNAFLSVWNYWNRRAIRFKTIDSSASYTYTSATPRAAGASNANRVSFITGMPFEDTVEFDVYSLVASATNATAFGRCGYAFGATNAIDREFRFYNPVAGATLEVSASVPDRAVTGTGLAFLQMTEAGDGSFASSFNLASDQCLTGRFTC